MPAPAAATPTGQATAAGGSASNTGTSIGSGPSPQPTIATTLTTAALSSGAATALGSLLPAAAPLASATGTLLPATASVLTPLLAPAIPSALPPLLAAASPAAIPLVPLLVPTTSTTLAPLLAAGSPTPALIPPGEQLPTPLAQIQLSVLVGRLESLAAAPGMHKLLTQLAALSVKDPAAVALLVPLSRMPAVAALRWLAVQLGALRHRLTGLAQPGPLTPSLTPVLPLLDGLARALRSIGAAGAPIAAGPLRGPGRTAPSMVSTPPTPAPTATAARAHHVVVAPARPHIQPDDSLELPPTTPGQLPAGSAALGGGAAGIGFLIAAASLMAILAIWRLSRSEHRRRRLLLAPAHWRPVVLIAALERPG